MQIIYLDISNKGVVPCVHAKQGEVGRKFLAVITDNGVPVILPNDALLSVWYEGETDTGNYSSIDTRSAFSIHRNNVTVELVAQMLFAPGKGELCLTITKGSGEEISTWNIPYEVEYKPGADSPVPTEYYTALTEAGALAAEAVGDARDAADEAKEAAEETKKDLTALLEKVIPVGYIFQWDSVADSRIDLTTPEKVAAHFGVGTWEQIKDTFLLACGENHTAGSVGGEETHTMTVDEMPSHTHGLPAKSERVSGTSWNGTIGTAEATEPSQPIVGYTGGGQPFNIMPPYRAVYVWKRIA